MSGVVSQLAMAGALALVAVAAGFAAVTLRALRRVVRDLYADVEAWFARLGVDTSAPPSAQRAQLPERRPSVRRASRRALSHAHGVPVVPPPKEGE